MTTKIAKDDIPRFHEYNLFLANRTLYMGAETYSQEHGESGTDGAMAERTIKNLHILESESHDPINVIMNNIGGDVNHGLAIFDALKACRSHTTITVYGHAMSMGSIILQAADLRIMSPLASQMIHYGSIGLAKEAKTVYKVVEEYKRIDRWMETLYLDKIHQQNPNFSLKSLRAMLSHDTFLTAKDSVELGLADQILGESK